MERIKKLVESERGIVLVITLLILTLLIGAGTGALVSTQTDLKTSGNLKRGTQAFYLAEAGAVYAQFALDDDRDLDNNGVSDQTQVFTNEQTVTWDSTDLLDDLHSGASGSVTIVRDSTDATLAMITSEAAYGGARTIIKVAVKRALAIPALPAAVTVISNGENEFDFEDDTSTNGVDESGTCGHVWGLVSSQLGFPDPDLEGGWLGGLLADGSTGGGTTDDTASWREFGTNYGDDPFWADPQNVWDLAGNWQNLPGAITIAGEQPPNTTLGTASNPQITTWDVLGSGGSKGCDFKGGPCIIQGEKISGYGILIVNGEIIFKRDIVWHGLIVQKSDRQITFQDDSEIHGAVIAVSTENLSEEATKVDIEDDTTIDFNCKAIEDYAGSLVGGFKGGSSGSGSDTVSWRQVL
ncbi:MAG: PilX N-terminal domain-containing pilus assembly protein [Dehalococcoidia bacterium]